MLKGWHIYPLQLDDLSDISYSSNVASQPGLARFDGGDTSELLRALAKFSIVPRRPAGQLHAPSAAEVGPIFYRWVVSSSAQCFADYPFGPETGQTDCLPDRNHQKTKCLGDLQSVNLSKRAALCGEEWRISLLSGSLLFLG